MEVKPGDIIIVKQENGEDITLTIGTNCVQVKANAPWTKLRVSRSSSFMIEATAVRK